MAKGDRGERRIDELYREPPERFVELRDRLARELRDEGEAKRAAEVKRRRRPTAAAFVVNRLGLEHPSDVKALVDAAEALRAAYASGDGERMRGAAAAERDAIAQLASLAEDEIAKAELRPTPALMDRVTETLRAVGGDEETCTLVQSGRLDRERKVATLGVDLADALHPKRAPARKGPRRGLEGARGELRRVRRELVAARKRSERAQAAVERAEGKLADARERERAAGKRIAALEGLAKRLEQHVASLE